MGNDFIDLFSDEVISTCRKCQGHMEYKGSGCYVCEKCGEEYLTDFGKVKRFINTYGASNALTISQETGVSRSKITRFLKDGRVEIVGNELSSVNFCASCGIPIRTGVYCNYCQKRLADRKKDAKAVFGGDLKKGESGHMRFGDRSEKK